MTLPNIGNAQTEEIGIGVVMRVVAQPRADGGLGFIFRRQEIADIGIDGHLEVLEQDSAEATGKIIGVQVKAGSSYFSHPYDGGWTVYIAKSTVRYWRQYAVPVILTLVDISTNTVYWTLVSTGDFAETEESYKIPVPAAQRLDATAADAIASIAIPAPPSLAARWMVSEGLATEQQAVIAAYLAAQTREDHVVAAERGWTLSESLRSQHPYEAAWTGQRSVRELARGGEVLAAGERLAQLLEWVLHEMRDGDTARSLLSMARAPDTPRQPPWTLGLPPSTLLRLETLEAEAEGLNGFYERAAQLAPRLASQADASTGSAATMLRSEAHRLNVIAAVAAEDHVNAVRSYEELAALLAAAEDHDAEAVARLRTLLHKGLNANYSESIEAVEQMSVPERMMADKTFVLGWLLGADGRYGDAGRVFRDAAANAIEHGDLYTALRASRNAERADARAGVLDFSERRPGKLAAGLEPLVEVTVKRQTTHERLMRRARAALANERLNTAFIAAQTARVLAWQDADPAAHEEATIQLAAIWRAAAVNTPTADLLKTAARETASTYATADQSEVSESARFMMVLREHMTGDFTESLWTEIVDGTDSAEAVVGALRFVAHLPNRWHFTDRDAKIASLIVRGLDIGWATPRASNGSGAAIDFVLSLDPPLQGDNAAHVRDAIADRLESVPSRDLADALNGLAVTAASAPTHEDGGSRIADKLFEQEERARAAGAEPQWIGAIAMLSKNATRETRERLRAYVSDYIGVAPQSEIQWIAVERALAAGIDLPDGLADRYLEREANLLITLREQVGTGSLGGGAHDDPALTSWASTRSSDASRERALSAAMTFLNEPGHLLTERRVWIRFIAVLARATPWLLPAAAECLATAARGELRPVGGFDDFTHPLSGGLRVVGHTNDGLRAHAIGWLGSLLPASTPRERTTILSQLRAGANDASPEVRSAVVRATGWVYRELANEPRQSSEPDEAQHELREAVRTILETLGKDHVDEISLEALRALHQRGGVVA
jgi:hypothetical protein